MSAGGREFELGIGDQVEIFKRVGEFDEMHFAEMTLTFRKSGCAVGINIPEGRLQQSEKMTETVKLKYKILHFILVQHKVQRVI